MDRQLVAKELLKAAKDLTAVDFRPDKLTFKAKGQIDEDELWEIVKDNRWFRIRDLFVQGRYVTIYMGGYVDMSTTKMKNFLRFMKDMGLTYEVG